MPLLAETLNTPALPASMTLFPHITHQKKRAFLNVFAALGGINKTCAALDVDHSQHYYWLKTDQAYAQAFEEAKRLAAHTLEEEALRRARDGVTRTVYHHGVPVGEERHYSDVLLIFLLKGMLPEKYRESRQERASTQTISDLLKAVLLEMATREPPRTVTPDAPWAPLSAPTGELPAPPAPDEHG
jgi:hypothetical protein